MMDPLQYANILQQNQMEMFQKMMEGMKDIIATTLMYDRKKHTEDYPTNPQPQAEPHYSSIPRELPLSQLRSPQLTNIHSPSPRHAIEPSMSLENIKSAYDSIDESKNFFRRPPQVKAFKPFQYIEKMGGSTLEIPNTSSFITSNDGF